jgi:flagellar protein FlbD
MIKLTRIHGSEIFINFHLIQWIEETPDTTLTFLNGSKIIVREKVSDIINIINDELNKT